SVTSDTIFLSVLFRLSHPNRQDPTATKRRLPEEDGPALKQFLSEDAVSARLQRLSLDNDHSYGSSGFPRILLQKTGCSSGEAEVPDEEEEGVLVDPGEFCMSSAKVLTVCPLLEETLRAPNPGEILPARLLRSLSSPCMELVLWSPPSSHIQKLIRSLTGLEPPPNKPSSPRCSRSGTPEMEDHMEL
ncbi:host cell factor C1 regulator 1, partial [Discoglossus pictus]